MNRNGWSYQESLKHCRIFTRSISACDGKHIMIQCPQKTGSTFFNYEGTFSIVLMAVINAKYSLTCVHIEYQGRNSDMVCSEKLPSAKDYLKISSAYHYQCLYRVGKSDHLTCWVQMMPSHCK